MATGQLRSTAHLKGSTATALVSHELGRIIQASAGRKYAKLHTDCKAVIDHFAGLSSEAPQAEVSKPAVGSESPPSSELAPASSDAGASVETGGAQDKEDQEVQDHKQKDQKTSTDDRSTAHSTTTHDSQVGGGGGCEEESVVGGLEREAAWRVLRVLRQASETRLPRVLEVVQDCLQRLVAQGHIQGGADAMLQTGGVGEQDAGLATKDAKPAEDAPTGEKLEWAPSVGAAVIELMCSGVEAGDESVELMLLKGMLTSVSCPTFQVHGEALLRVVRTCYNIYLASKSEVNQTTAKACLTQMLAAVFHRMEADSASAPLQPIVVADLLRPSQGEDQANPMLTFVQSFLNKVLTDLEAALYPTSSSATWDTDMHPEHEDQDAASKPGGFQRYYDGPGEGDGEVHADIGDIQQAQESLASAAAACGSASASSSPRPEAGSSSSSSCLPPAEGRGERESAGDLSAAAAGLMEGQGCDSLVDPSLSPNTQVLRRDAFLVFRALCKLAMKSAPEGTVDPFQARGKALSLELIKILLENAGAVFHSSPKFIGAIKQYLCMALLKNASHPSPQSFQLCTAIFGTLLHKFRDSLKAEMGVFYPMMLLRVLESPGSSYGARAVVLRSLQAHCQDPQLLVDLFVNYDCDLESSNLFERTINLLARVAQKASPQQDPGALLSQPQEAALGQYAMQCLVYVLKSLSVWIDQNSSVAPPSVPPASSSLPLGASTSSLADSDSVGGKEGSKEEDSGKESGDRGGGGQAKQIEAMKANKTEFMQGVALFNTKPQKGVKFLMEAGKLGSSAEDVSAFLKSTSTLDRTMIGEYLGERADFNLAVMHCYVDSLDFTSLSFDAAIRHFLAGFRLPGEAQKIDRLMEKFAERYCKNNPRQFKSADTAYVLAYSVIMLNTDAHNDQVKTKMTKEDFIRNNRGIDDGKDLDRDFLCQLYDGIVSNEIRMKSSDLASASSGGGGGKEVKGVNQVLDKMGQDPAQAARIGLDLLLNLLPGRRAGAGEGVTEEAIQSMQAKLRSGAATSWSSASAVEVVRPMLEVSWPPMLACFAMPMEDSEDPHTVNLCLDGFRYAIHITCVLSLETLRDAFVTSVSKFTLLHAPANMQPKNVQAIKALALMAVEEGNHLSSAWVHVLKCVSRFDLVYQLSAGVMTDAAMFANPGRDGEDKGGARAMSAKIKLKASQAIHKLYGITAPHQHPHTHPRMESVTSGGAVPPSPLSAVKGGHTSPHGQESSPLAKPRDHTSDGELDQGALEMLRMASTTSQTSSGGEHDANGMSLQAQAVMSASSSSVSGVGLEEHPPPAGVMEAIDPMEVNRMFVSSERLNSEAVVAFVRALCQVSLEELRSSRPRVFALTKIVEISHFNMSRIRLVWTRIWVVLADYFVTVGCHPNLQIAMYAVDSLRQLSMKFLERDELSNYHFQNDFLKPFVVVMRQSPNVEIRELIIRCVSQMVLARVANIKSGWKSMFMVFTTAAADEQRSIVALAFETIEKIVREYFGHITETETATFTDCCNCLIAFTNSPFNMDVSLNAIAFLRFCALKLAEGSIGRLELPPASSAPAQAAEATITQDTNDVDVYFWFPLLAGLSELTFDPRPAIRRSSLEVLFDILRDHGRLFSPPFWTRVFTSVLLPIFDHVRSADFADEEMPPSMGAGQADSHPHSELRGDHIDAWLYETCTHCLQHVVDLFTQFFEVIGSVLPRVLTLLGSFISRPHERLAAVGVAALSRLIQDTGTHFTPHQWDLTLSTLQDVVVGTLPDVYSLVGPLPTDPAPFHKEATTTIEDTPNSTPLKAASTEEGGGESGRVSQDRQVSLDPAASSSSSSPPGASCVSSSSSAAVPAPVHAWLRLRRRLLALQATQASLLTLAAQLLSQHQHTTAADKEHTPARSPQDQGMEAAEVVACPLSRAQIGQVLGLLLRPLQHAQTANTDQCLRSLVRIRLEDIAAQIPAASRPQLMSAVKVEDPPLLRLETQAATHCLAVLQPLHSQDAKKRLLVLSQGKDHQAPQKEEEEDVANVNARLVDLTTQVIRTFLDVSEMSTVISNQGSPKSHNAVARNGSGGRAESDVLEEGVMVAEGELDLRAPVVVSALQGMGAFSPDFFRSHLSHFFPILTELIRCESAPMEVHRELSLVFSHCVGPILVEKMSKHR